MSENGKTEQEIRDELAGEDPGFVDDVIAVWRETTGVERQQVEQLLTREGLMWIDEAKKEFEERTRNQ